jgi:hypothetical protein
LTCGSTGVSPTPDSAVGCQRRSRLAFIEISIGVRSNNGEANRTRSHCVINAVKLAGALIWLDLARHVMRQVLGRA